MVLIYLKLMEDNHFSLECNYRDIYRIAINKLMSIVIVISLLSLSTTGHRLAAKKELEVQRHVNLSRGTLSSKLSV